MTAQTKGSESYGVFACIATKASQHLNTCSLPLLSQLLLWLCVRWQIWGLRDCWAGLLRGRPLMLFPLRRRQTPSLMYSCIDLMHLCQRGIRVNRSSRHTTSATSVFLYEDTGQASLEAALLLPSLLLVMALLIQPACFAYTRCIMQSAAAEACRLMTTSTHNVIGVQAAYKDYVLRRLSAVPNVSIFHTGGPEAWDIELEGSMSEHTAHAYIKGSAHPLPFMGVIAALLNNMDENGDVVLEVDVQTKTRPDWLEGGYSDWSQIW